MIDAIIFDLDGTLWNATLPAYKALRFVEDKYGAQATDYDTFCSLMGKPMDEIAANTMEGLPLEKKKSIFKEFYSLELALIRKEGSILYPHMVDTLKKLKDHYPLFIVSNCQEGYIETFLETHNLGELFKDYISWGERNKPKGENILYIMKKNSIKSPVYVGDTRGDELAADHAGIHYYHVDFGFGQALKPYKTISNFKQLEEEFLPDLTEK
ncbi:MAG: HAD family hydrolase [Tissierellia bacterium]|nr:HAD family hydrolase [Tissierellia bacterium]